VPPPIQIEIYQRFGGTHCFHLQRRRLELTGCITVDRVRIYHIHSKTAAVNLWELFFFHENGGNILFRRIDKFVPDYTAPHFMIAL